MDSNVLEVPSSPSDSEPPGLELENLCISSSPLSITPNKLAMEGGSSKDATKSADSAKDSTTHVPGVSKTGPNVLIDRSTTNVNDESGPLFSIFGFASDSFFGTVLTLLFFGCLCITVYWCWSHYCARRGSQEPLCNNFNALEPARREAAGRDLPAMVALDDLDNNRFGRISAFHDLRPALRHSPGRHVRFDGELFNGPRQGQGLLLASPQHQGVHPGVTQGGPAFTPATPNPALLLQQWREQGFPDVQIRVVPPSPRVRHQGHQGRQAQDNLQTSGSPTAAARSPPNIQQQQQQTNAMLAN